MLNTVAAELDFIEELRLRRWARENYVSREQRQVSWHPVVLEEMDRKDLEIKEVELAGTCA
jgi:phage antirepressor YoqD-like protein